MSASDRPGIALPAPALAVVLGALAAPGLQGTRVAEGTSARSRIYARAQGASCAAGVSGTPTPRSDPGGAGWRALEFWGGLAATRRIRCRYECVCFRTNGYRCFRRYVERCAGVACWQCQARVTRRARQSCGLGAPIKSCFCKYRKER